MTQWNKGSAPTGVPLYIKCSISYFKGVSRVVISPIYISSIGVMHYDEHYGIGCEWKNFDWSIVVGWKECVKGEMV